MRAHPEPVRLLVADDHTLLREALVEVLSREPGFKVIGQADDGESCLRLARQTSPAVVLLDLGMPDHRPAHTVRQLLRLSPAPKVIILTMHDDPDLVSQMLALGAQGFLYKGVSRQDLITAIYGIVKGRQTVTVVTPRARPILPLRPPTPLVLLTEREREVLTLVARALSNRQIAVQLEITEGTVKRHLRNVFGKLGAVSRIDAVNKAAASVVELKGYEVEGYELDGVEPDPDGDPGTDDREARVIS